MLTVETVLTPIVQFITLTSWTVVGFLFWLPMIARAIALLSAATLYATINRLGPSYLHPAKAQLAAATTFWSDGFAYIRASADDIAPEQHGTPIEFNYMRVLVELATTLIFWLGFWLALGVFRR
jgi:hypothetical protein